MRRYSNSTVFSPATVRPIPTIDAPAACVQCSSICLFPPGAVCQWPDIHEISASVGVCTEANTHISITTASFSIHSLLNFYSLCLWWLMFRCLPDAAVGVLHAHKDDLFREPIVLFQVERSHTYCARWW